MGRLWKQSNDLGEPFNHTAADTSSATLAIGKSDLCFDQNFGTLAEVGTMFECLTLFGHWCVLICKINIYITLLI